MFSISFAIIGCKCLTPLVVSSFKKMRIYSTAIIVFPLYIGLQLAGFQNQGLLQFRFLIDSVAQLLLLILF